MSSLRAAAFSARCLLLLLPLAVACGDGGTNPGGGPVVDCGQTDPIHLSVGEFVTRDPSETACVRLPAAGSGGAEYLYLAVSAAPTESNAGTSTPYRLVGSGEDQPTAAVRSRPLMDAAAQPTEVQRFHARMRGMEQRLARQPHPARAAAPAGLSLKAAPSLGDKRTFSVLKSADSPGTSAGDFVSVTATVKHVGQKVVIYLDDSSPTTGGYSQGDIDAIGSLFDDELYPIDTTAFGRESDVDGDGQVLVLLTDQVTRLAGCNNGQVVVGFFFALDLFEGEVGSNGAEVFYGLTPDPACSVDRDRAVELLPGVFIHEFQHMINFNQHVLVRNGNAEDTWLNEGLSGYAEELGARQVPDSRCVNSDCLTQFGIGDFINAYDFLASLEENYLIGPAQPPLPLTEYGATWLFVRWLGDHFSGSEPLAPDLTRKLVQTNRTGADNVENATGEDFPTLITQWHLANYVESLGQFTPADDKITYTSLALRENWAVFNQKDPLNFQHPYPLVPDVTSGGYETAGSLLAGSGKHVLVQQDPNAQALDFKITRSDGSTVLPSSAAARVAVLRIR
ncbi:MAG TPA: hypothetical protein VJQ44_17400 [Gemmatimonadales bacterium]|nr:hypothetical protein [Gemmatimonadales bacterium]